jgi:molybdopterin-biosynthesis enzyme MoeA-like protein
VIQQSLDRADIVITTGGLGPTVDDPTREAVALAAGVETEYRPELWEQIQARFRRFNREPTLNNQRQAYIPQGALAVENPVGTAPAFIVEKNGKAVIALPGVPREMEYLVQHAVIPYLKNSFHLKGMIKTRVIHTAGAGESQIDDRISDLELLSNPTIGLAAHSGQVDVRITAKAVTEAEADRMIAELEETVRLRLGSWVYGADQQTLEETALKTIAEQGWGLVFVEAGLGGELSRRLGAMQEPFRGGQVIPGRLSNSELQAAVEKLRQSRRAEVGLGVTLHPGQEKQEIYLVLITPTGMSEFLRPYGGPPQNAPRWAMHHSLDIIRNLET